MATSTSEQVWGYRWRSSTSFIVTALAIGLFTDSFLNSFIVPILPNMVEDRAGLDPSYTQSVSSWLLAENAVVSVILRIPFGHFADKCASKLSWLLWALVASLFGTICTAMESSLLMLFASRLVQAIAETVIWVVGVTVIADVVPIQHIGKTYTTVFMASSAGNSIGPMVSGVLYQLAGYWPAWSSAFAIISTDIVFRLLIIETPHSKKSDKTATNTDPDSEMAPFLDNQEDGNPPPPKENAAPNFYKCILRKPIFTGGLYCAFMYSLLDTTFTTTLPLHVRDAFHWGGMASGFMFATLQIPRMALSPLCGWLKDRVGTRIPIVFAFAMLAPLMWLLGVPGNDSFPWANAHGRGPALYVLAMALIGASSSLLSGAGSIEATVAVDELQKEYPHAFGPNGGKSRALAITGVAYTFGSFTGPILAGTLCDKYGYYMMNSIVAGICAVSAVVVFYCLRSKVGSHTKT